MTLDRPEMSWDSKCLSPSGLLVEFLCGVLDLLSRRTKGVSVIRGTERRESLGITGSRLPGWVLSRDVPGPKLGRLSVSWCRRRAQTGEGRVWEWVGYWRFISG